MANGVQSVMVEFNRFGEAGSILQKGSPYIRTTGDERPACEVKLGLGYADFENAFYALRYTKDVTPAQTAEAIDALEKEAIAMFDGLGIGQTADTIQVDVVTSASELWAFPFEALARGKDDVVVTRRIRGSFGEHVAWPPVPKVLFVHAAIGKDLPQQLIDSHVAALTDALRSWAADPIKEKRLVVKPIDSLDALKEARAGDFTHIHLLAHGIEVPSRTIRSAKVWGMRLGLPKTPGVHPDDVAEALGPNEKGLPVAITIASCDSGNQADTAPAAYSLAQVLHRSGVSVVVASQLPLTMHGSIVLTKEFYERALGGEDIRTALHRTRIALRGDEDARHDWLSIVSYVRLPETYAEHLDRVALKMEIAILRAAHTRMDAALRNDDKQALDEVEASIRKRIDELTKRLPKTTNPDDRLECQGLLASAYKRLAELLFLAKRNPAEQLSSLKTSLDHYRRAFQSNFNMHWHGVQQLALQAVLEGSFDPIDYEIVMRAAKNDANNFWHQGTLAELYLLSGFVQKPFDAQAAATAVQAFLAGCAGNEDSIDSTRRQLLRYTNWWIPKDFQTNLAIEAAALAAILK